MRIRRALTIWMVLVLGVGRLVGCSDPRAAKPTQTRLARIADYQAKMRDRENEGPHRLAAVSHLIEDQARREQAHLDRDLNDLREWSQGDLQRWHDRQPRYRADLQDLWDGNPSLANEVIPIMFY